MSRLEVLALAFGVTIVVAGSLWIMTNLNVSMMPPPELMYMHIRH
jgi:heme/copper-type cytochrome/quinol oxidase subunit 4